MSAIAHAPYPTDGSDYRGAVKHHYWVAFKRFAKYMSIFVSMYALAILTQIDYLFPLLVIGLIGSMITTLASWGALTLIFRCWRVLRTYPMEFRRPVEKGEESRGARLALRFGDTDEVHPPLMRAIAVTRPGWPQRMSEGVWFAGDDAFGGVALVPESGELLLMQPREWDLSADARAEAGEERVRKAKRAGIKRRLRIR